MGISSKEVEAMLHAKLEPLGMRQDKKINLNADDEDDDEFDDELDEDADRADDEDDGDEDDLDEDDEE